MKAPFTIFMDTWQGEYGLMRNRGIIEFFDLETHEPYDMALIMEGSPAVERYKEIKDCKSIDEFVIFVKSTN